MPRKEVSEVQEGWIERSVCGNQQVGVVALTDWQQSTWYVGVERRLAGINFCDVGRWVGKPAPSSTIKTWLVVILYVGRQLNDVTASQQSIPVVRR